MKRYFLVADADMPGHDVSFGQWHSISLGSHGAKGAGWHVLALTDDHSSPNPKWIAMPSLLDSGTTLAGKLPIATLLGDIGLTGAETMFQAAQKLGAIYSPLRG